MSTVRKVGVVGWGAIGRIVGTALADGQVDGAELVCVVDNRPLGDAAPAPQVPLEEALELCDLIVEAAGQGVVREWGERVLASGTDLLVASSGAMTDEELAKRLLAAGPGRSRSWPAPPARFRRSSPTVSYTHLTLPTN